MKRIRQVALFLGLASVSACGRIAYDPLHANDASVDLPVDDARVDAPLAVDMNVPSDAGVDSFVSDAFVPDAFVPDAFVPDAFVPDAFVPDAFVPDAFVPDAEVDMAPPVMGSVTVSPTAGLVTTEMGDTASFTVVLDIGPTATVSIALSSDDTSEGTVSPALLTFTPSDWDTPQTVTVTGVDDFLVDGVGAYNIVTAAASSTDAAYNGIVIADVAVTNNDDDHGFISVSPTVGLVTTEAGGSATFQVTCSAMPTADVVVQLDSSNLQEGTASPSTITFTSANWSVAQIVTVTGVNDAILDGDVMYSIVTQPAVSADGAFMSYDAEDILLTNTSNAFESYVKASNTTMGQNFAGDTAISADGNTLAVGAYFESSNATGVNGNQTDVSAPVAGAVYVFVRSGGVWTQQAYIKASNTRSLAAFGYNLTISADGDTLAVGAYGDKSNATGIGGNQADTSFTDAGAVYVFTRTGTMWSQQAYVKASNTGNGDIFGWNSALSSDGNTLAVGARGEASNATGVGGNQADNSVSQAGAVYVFTRSAGVWTQQAYVKASNTDSIDRFAWTILLSGDGDTLAVGAPHESSNATGVDGDQLNNLASGSGAVYVFTRAGVVWSQSAYIKASNTETNDQFGGYGAMSTDGTTLVVGAIIEASNATGVGGDQLNNANALSGAAYVFRRTGAVWAQEAYIKASNSQGTDFFGYSPSLSGDGNLLAIGATGEDSGARIINGDQSSNAQTDTGAVYFFSRAGSTWTQLAYVKSPNGDANDRFGFSTSLSSDGTTLVVGAYGESSNAIGVGGDQANNLAPSSGAAYVYRTN